MVRCDLYLILVGNKLSANEISDTYDQDSEADNHSLSKATTMLHT